MPFLFALVLMASSAKAVVETQVEAGEAQIYQSVETTYYLAASKTLWPFFTLPKI